MSDGYSTNLSACLQCRGTGWVGDLSKVYGPACQTVLLLMRGLMGACHSALAHGECLQPDKRCSLCSALFNAFQIVIVTDVCIFDAAVSLT